MTAMTPGSNIPLARRPRGGGRRRPGAARRIGPAAHRRRQGALRRRLHLLQPADRARCDATAPAAAPPRRDHRGHRGRARRHREDRRHRQPGRRGPDLPGHRADGHHPQRRRRQRARHLHPAAAGRRDRAGRSSRSTCATARGRSARSARATRTAWRASPPTSVSPSRRSRPPPPAAAPRPPPPPAPPRRPPPGRTRAVAARPPRPPPRRGARRAPAPGAGKINLDKGRVSLQKNQTVSLVKGGRPLLSQVKMGLGWEPAFRGKDIDLDASVIAYGPQRNHIDSCYFGKLVHPERRDQALRRQPHRRGRRATTR